MFFHESWWWNLDYCYVIRSQWKRKMAKRLWFRFSKVKKVLLGRYLSSYLLLTDWGSDHLSLIFVSFGCSIINLNFFEEFSILCHLQISIEPFQGKKIEHNGVKVELLGQIGLSLLLVHCVRPSFKYHFDLVTQLGWVFKSIVIYYLLKMKLTLILVVLPRDVFWQRQFLWLYLPRWVYDYILSLLLFGLPGKF